MGKGLLHRGQLQLQKSQCLTRHTATSWQERTFSTHELRGQYAACRKMCSSATNSTGIHLSPLYSYSYTTLQEFIIYGKSTANESKKWKHYESPLGKFPKNRQYICLAPFYSTKTKEVEFIPEYKALKYLGCLNFKVMDSGFLCLQLCLGKTHKNHKLGLQFLKGVNNSALKKQHQNRFRVIKVLQDLLGTIHL